MKPKTSPPHMPPPARSRSAPHPTYKRAPPELTKQFLIRVTPELHQRVTEYAAKRAKPVSNYIRAYLLWLIGEEVSAEMPRSPVSLKESRLIENMRGYKDDEEE